MKQRTHLFLCISVTAVLFAFTSCDSVIITNYGGGQYDEYHIEFEKQTDETVLFASNNKQFIGPNGSTYWKVGTLIHDWSSAYSVSMVRPTGSLKGGYGVVFSERLNDERTHFFVLINAYGEYKIGKRKSWEVYPGIEIIRDWTASGYLLDGINSNTITVTYDGDANEYRIFFNADPDGIVVTEDAEIAPAGKIGYMAELLACEDFPDNPVEVRFTQVTPADIGIQ
jgi:hypothetical protein